MTSTFCAEELKPKAVFSQNNTALKMRMNMRVFIWESVGHCTTSYHNGGAVFTSDPGHIIEALSTEQEKAWCFQAGGCC